MNAFDYFFENSHALEKDFLLGSKETLSYPELYLKSMQVATYIATHFAEDEKILLLSHNNPFFLSVYLGILKSGRTCVPLNPDIEPNNLNYIIGECQARVAFVASGIRNRYQLDALIVLSESDVEHFTNAESQKPSGATQADSCAEIIFTSGSTGVPKGVMISHQNLIANTESIVEYLQLSEKDIMEVVLPFYYCYGLSLLHTHLRVGGSIVLNNAFIFLGTVLNDLKKYRCTGFAGVPSHFQILLRKSESFKRSHFPDLRYVTQAGGKLHTVFIEEFREAQPKVSFYVMYGQTEATARLSYLPPALLDTKLGSIGKGIPNVELRVIGPNGIPVQPGEQGEITARGKNIMLGYLNDSTTTLATLQNGWLHTGDLATVDEDGYIFLQARSKEIIKVGGKRISPKEIEEVLVSIPEVIDCTVFGIHDELLGEAVKANVVIDKSQAGAITVDFIRNYCGQRLAAFKVPQVIDIQDRVSISSTGKKVKAAIG